MTTNTLPARLKEARKSASLTQVQVAERADVTQGNLSGYETGARAPELATLTRLADVYGVSLDWLVGRDTTATRYRGHVRTAVRVHHATGTVERENPEAIKHYGRDIPVYEVTDRSLNESQAIALAELLLEEHAA